MKYLIFVILIFIFCICGCAKKREVYHHRRAGFKFVLPKEWVVVSSNDYSLVVRSEESDMILHKFIAQLTIYVNHNADGIAYLDETFRLSVKEKLKEFKGQLLTNGAGQIDGKESRWFAVLKEDGNVLIGVLTVKDVSAIYYFYFDVFTKDELDAQMDKVSFILQGFKFD